MSLLRFLPNRRQQLIIAIGVLIALVLLAGLLLTSQTLPNTVSYVRSRQTCKPSEMQRFRHPVRHWRGAGALALPPDQPLSAPTNKPN